jgi:uncharacterized protein (TIGR02646 family)
MRNLRKLSIPSDLETNINEWTKEYLEKCSTGEEISEALKSKYRDSRIKELLLRETNGKCAYCESKITHISFGDVEHIVPKTKMPELTFLYSNLTLACSICNNNKSSLHGDEESIINPYSGNPEQKMFALGIILYAKSGSPDADNTITLLDLNRAGLLEKRREKVDKIVILIDRWFVMKPGAIKDAILKQIIKEGSSDKEYSFVVSQAIRYLTAS